MIPSPDPKQALSPADSARHVALEPCPFCGLDVTDDEGCFPVGRDRWEVRCGNPSCFAHEPSDETEEGAIARWNRRALRQGGEAWQPIATAPEEAPYWIVWSAYYKRPVVVTQRQDNNTYWEGDWDFDVQATHWWPALPHSAGDTP